MHALIQNDTITHVGPLPRLWRGGDRWHDLSDDDGTQAAALGWLPVTYEPRPDDTAATTWERAEPALVNGQPVVGWTERPKTAEELQAEADAAAAQARYETHEAILDATAALMADAHEDGAAWVQPTGAHDAYALGITVTHNGKTWENITPANVYAPGVSGWREVVAEGYPAWVQPAGAHDAYILGAKVTHNGRLWECTQVAAGVNAYEPGVWGWTVRP